MRKIIEVDEVIIPKLKLLAAIEGTSVKKLMEDAVLWYINHKEKERMNSLSSSEKEDLGLLLLMQQANMDTTVTENELFNNS